MVEIPFTPGCSRIIPSVPARHPLPPRGYASSCFHSMFSVRCWTLDVSGWEQNPPRRLLAGSVSCVARLSLLQFNRLRQKRSGKMVLIVALKSYFGGSQGKSRQRKMSASFDHQLSTIIPPPFQSSHFYQKSRLLFASNSCVGTWSLAILWSLDVEAWSFSPIRNPRSKIRK